MGPPSSQFRLTEVQEALASHRRRHRQRFAGLVVFGLVTYLAWVMVREALTMLTAGPELPPSAVDALRNIDWGLGVSPDVALGVALAGVALVAAITIASAASTAPDETLDSATRAVGWKGWLDALSTGAYATMVVTVAVALSQAVVATSEAVPVLLVILAMCWVTANLYLTTHDRLGAALRDLTAATHAETVRRIRRRLPGLPRLGWRGAILPLGLLVLVAGVSAVPYLIESWVDYGSALRVHVVASWVCLSVAAAAWSLRVTGKGVASAVGWLVAAVLFLAALEVVSAAATEAWGDGPAVWWTRLSWLLGTGVLLVSPRLNPMAYAALLVEYDHARRDAADPARLPADGTAPDA